MVQATDPERIASRATPRAEAGAAGANIASLTALSWAFRRPRGNAGRRVEE
jgi:hypothetical protein